MQPATVAETALATLPVTSGSPVPNIARLPEAIFDIARVLETEVGAMAFPDVAPVNLAE